MTSNIRQDPAPPAPEKSSPPHPVSELVRLQRHLLARQSELSVHPVRVEVAPSLLLDAGPETLRLAGALRSASFLGITWREPPTLGELEQAGQLGQRHALYLDLRLKASECLPPLPLETARRTARLILESSSPKLLLHTRALLKKIEVMAREVAGRVLIRLEVQEPELAEALALMQLLGQAREPLALHLVPATPRAQEALHAARESFWKGARAARLNLSIRRVGSFLGGPLPDPCLAWNLQHAFYRTLFVRHPALCPFPFLMLRLDKDGIWRPCPRTEGPILNKPGQGEVWNGSQARTLRQAFFEGGLPQVCRRCTLWPRVQRALQEGA